MNKLTKVGLTALAGSLAAVAGANAGSLTVSGGSDITWMSKTGNTTSTTDAMTGNPIGWKNNITFGASGELDNGISWTANAYNSDAQALTSSNISFDLGGMGSLLVDNGAGGAGLDALDDKMPTAWEETHGAGLDSGAVTVTGVHGSASLTYSLPTDSLPAGTKIRVGYTPRADGGGLQADMGTSGVNGNGKDSAWDITVEVAPVEGLNVFAGYAAVESDDPNTSGVQGGHDQESGTYGATFTAGAFEIGAQQSYISSNTGTTQTIIHYDNVNWGIAFNVNDNLSLSYANFESEEVMGTTGGQTLDMDSLQLAYNMGGATLKFANTDASDVKYAAGAEMEVNTVALALAF